MPSELASEVAPLIVKLVADSPQQSASGTRIVAAVRSTFPAFSAQAEGYRSFREFIRNFVPQVGESSQRAGMDVIYVIKAPNTAESSPQISPTEAPSKPSGFVSLLLGNPRAWKTFASPLSTSRIYVDRAGSNVLVSSAHVPPPGPDWLRIDPISASSLLGIARDFIDLIPELYRPALTDSLTKPKWWIPYFEVMGSLGLKSRWVAFRRRRILDEFVKAVTARATDLAFHVADPSSSRNQDSFAEAVSDPQKGIAEAKRGLGVDDRLRAIAIAVVRQMTEQELRALVVPLGYLADALDQIS